MQEKLTIIMPTFNKQDYISDALDSILSQNVNFKYRLIIADDCSSDNTLNIVDKYKARFDCMEVLTSEKNQGLFYNIVRAYGMLDTEYFCVLDPDDYYTDNDFLQISIDFLENNKDYAIYSANVEMLDGDIKKPYVSDLSSFSSDFNTFLKNQHIAFSQTAGCVYRNIIFKNGLPNNLKYIQHDTCKDTFRGDSFRNIIHLEKGMAYYDPKCRACYRITDSGLWQGSSNIKREILTANLYKNLYFYFDCKYDELLYMSCKHFSLIEKHLLDLIENNVDIKYITQLIELKKILQDNCDVYYRVYNAKYSKLRLKDKIRLKIFNSIENKLKNKGII